jgi:hypothetical protein
MVSVIRLKIAQTEDGKPRIEAKITSNHSYAVKLIDENTGETEIEILD